ncbi:PREDICTED: NAC transcription factor 29 [Nelumbo nucifera]|uniref:NAC domain-containing protein n=2 Tax=Nelumbo nucifera TaxID=4432 RepID=A0A822ZL53_NELNU|nr:PREDICTED: NAC transcription factor 29 [Nelumbo nucifera]DAD44099.1 TPA_asm: hypothetical protein HUJ06_002329 [Nelumbo nucifera]
MAPVTLPPGFRFHPTDEELVAYYLDRKVHGRTIELEIIPEVDLYKCEPWELPDKSYLPSKDMEWYFFSPRDRKYPNGSRTNRATRAGYWKATGKDRMVHSHKRPVGMKKTLVYYRGRAPHGIRTNWVMHEYRLADSVSEPGSSSSSALRDAYALCRVFKKTIQVPKTKEEQNGCSEELHWLNNEREGLLGDDTSGNVISQRREVGEETYDQDTSRILSDASSSEVTEGTPMHHGTTDDQHVSFASDEANSSTNVSPLNVDYFSNLSKEITVLPNCTRLQQQQQQQQQLSYPPLALEDFPQMDTLETKLSNPQAMDEYMMPDKYRTYNSDTNIILEEIFYMCSSQDNSMILSLQDYCNNSSNITSMEIHLTQDNTSCFNNQNN